MKCRVLFFLLLGLVALGAAGNRGVLPPGEQCNAPEWYDEAQQPWVNHWAAAAQGAKTCFEEKTGKPFPYDIERVRDYYGFGKAQVEAPRTAYYALFSDMGGDPDDQQSLRRLMFYPEITPDFILVQNGNEGFQKAAQGIQEYTLDFPRLKQIDPSFKDPAHWYQSLFPSLLDTREDDFNDHFDQELNAAQRAFVAFADRVPGPIDVWLWGPATDLALILWKRLDLGAKIRVISIGAWNKEQDPSAHEFLKAALPHLKGWVNMDSQFRGMYCDYPGNTAFVRDVIGTSGALGLGYFNISVNVDTGSYSIKEGDTPTFLFSLGVLKGNCSWENPNLESCWAGTFKRDSEFPHHWTDGDGGSACGYRGAQSIINRRDEFQADFAGRLKK